MCRLCFDPGATDHLSRDTHNPRALPPVAAYDAHLNKYGRIIARRDRDVSQWRGGWYGEAVQFRMVYDDGTPARWVSARQVYTPSASKTIPGYDWESEYQADLARRNAA